MSHQERSLQHTQEASWTLRLGLSPDTKYGKAFSMQCFHHHPHSAPLSSGLRDTRQILVTAPSDWPANRLVYMDTRKILESKGKWTLKSGISSRTQDCAHMVRIPFRCQVWFPSFLVGWVGLNVVDCLERKKIRHLYEAIVLVAWVIRKVIHRDYRTYAHKHAFVR